MSRIAVFVDAGYFFAQGSVAIWGAKQPRATLDLDEKETVARLTGLALRKAPNASLLRIYWYDGAGTKGPTLEQLRLARLDNIKIRLGFLNSRGQQKGVDSLIVTDLVDLARNRAMTDAVLLAGDEDVRIGVQIAQSFGVRVHLVGIHPSRGSQSAQLIDEADTTLEWDSATMNEMLSQRASPIAAAPATAGPTLPHTGCADLDKHVDDFFAGLTAADISGIQAFWAAGNRGIPPELDGKLLATARNILHRDLTTDEKQLSRRRLSEAVNATPQI